MAAIAFVAPLALALVPRLPVPPVVLELAAGLVVGPQVLGLLSIDDPVAVLSLLGLAMLLFLAGLEIDVHELRGPLFRVAAAGFVASFALALVVGVLLGAVGAVKSPIFLAIVLSSTSLGVVVPVLKDAGLVARPFGQLVIAGASIADVATIVLLSLLFSTESSSPTARAVLLGGLGGVALVVGLGVRAARTSMQLGDAIMRLSGTTAEIRVRGAMLLLIAFVAIAQHAGLEVILGAFVAGALLSALDPQGMARHPEFRAKLQGVGFGVLIPVFFVASGLRFDLDALLDAPSAIAKVPLFLCALLVVRALPTVLYRRVLEPGQWPTAGLLQATSLPFVVAATQIGVVLRVISPASAAGLIAAGLISVLVFPAAAVARLAKARAPERAPSV